MSTLLKPSTTNPQTDRLLSTIVERLTEQSVENKLDVIPSRKGKVVMVRKEENSTDMIF